MTDTKATPTEKPANLTALQLQLLDLAARSKQVPVERSQVAYGPAIVIHGKTSRPPILTLFCQRNLRHLGVNQPLEILVLQLD